MTAHCPTCTCQQHTSEEAQARYQLRLRDTAERVAKSPINDFTQTERAWLVVVESLPHRLVQARLRGDERRVRRIERALRRIYGVVA